MPDLDSKIHLKMLRSYQRKRYLIPRLWKAIKKELASAPVYGLEWGDPENVQPLKFIRDRYVLPYIKEDQIALEIGPGGGRWTRYLLGFKKLYIVDFHNELLEELQKYFSKPNMEFIRNNGTDFPGIKERSIDFLFSFGTFVHLETSLIEAYLTNIKPILKPDANVVIHYSDQTKIMAQLNKGFSDNTPEKMQKMVTDAGYKILEEDLTTMWHSSVIRFTT